MKYPVEMISNQIQIKITETLNRMGIMFRIFGRVKEHQSLLKKLTSDPKYGESKFLQDYIGIRIVLYFADDVTAVHKALNNEFNERKKDQSIDNINETTFKPVRYNLIYDVPEKMEYELHTDLKAKVDKTFELQIRTVLSEGWHEVEHDFRYKHKDDWKNFPVESRMLNGVYASLETNEWTMLKIFDEISYGHYKLKNWEAMLRQKLRLKLTSTPLKQEFNKMFNEDAKLAKDFFRIERLNLIKLLNEKTYDYPMNIDSLIMFANIFIVKSDKIFNITPTTFSDDFIETPFSPNNIHKPQHKALEISIN